MSARSGRPATRHRRAGRRGAEQRDALMRLVLGAAALVSLVTVTSILLFLIYFCLPLITGGQLSRLASWQWQPYQGHFGILPMAVGSLCLAVVALAMAYPLAIGICGLPTAWHLGL